MPLGSGDVPALRSVSSRGSDNVRMTPSHAGNFGCRFQGKSSVLVRYLLRTGSHRASDNAGAATSSDA